MLVAAGHGSGVGVDSQVVVHSYCKIVDILCISQYKVLRDVDLFEGVSSFICTLM